MMDKISAYETSRLIHKICAKGCPINVQNDRIILGKKSVLSEGEIEQIIQKKEDIKNLFKCDINNLILGRLSEVEYVLYGQGLNLYDWVGEGGLFSEDDLIDMVRGEYSHEWLKGYVNAVDYGKVAKTTQTKQCGECIHFQRDTIGDGSGLGQCMKFNEARWPRPKSECDSHVNRSLLQQIKAKAYKQTL